MRRLSLVLLGTLALFGTGCFVNAYPADPQERMRALLNQSEDLRQIQAEWMRFWFVDQPSHMTYDRIDGSLQ